MDKMDIDMENINLFNKFHPKYNYNLINIPQINVNDINKPYIYILIDKLSTLYDINKTKNKNTDKIINKNDNQNIDIDISIKKTIKELYNYILKNPLVLIDKYLIFTPFIYALYCNENIIDRLYKIYLNLSKEVQKNFLIKPWDYTSIYNFTPLHFAVYLNKSEIIRYMFKMNILGNKTDINGNTALHLACILKRNDIISKIVYYKYIDLNILNHFGESALYICVMTNYVDGVKKLLEHNASTTYIFQGKSMDLKNILKEDDKLPSVKRKIHDDIKGFFIQKEVFKSRQSSFHKKNIKKSQAIKEFLRLHSNLCKDLSDISNIDYLQNIALRIGIKNAISVEKSELCKKIASKMLIKSYSKNYF